MLTISALKTVLGLGILMGLIEIKLFVIPLIIWGMLLIEDTSRK
jgi:hypothetical protein